MSRSAGVKRLLGAVVGAVLSGGTATPLIVAALASGLTSMAANYAIKGGRYGWEQAGIDLGMTLVQAATAGLGQKLGAAAQLAIDTKAGTLAVGQTAASDSVRAGVVFTRQPKILVQDADGNLVANSSAAVVATIGSGADLSVPT